MLFAVAVTALRHPLNRVITRLCLGYADLCEPPGFRVAAYLERF